MIVEERGPVLVVVRGDHRLNEIKLQNALGAAARAGAGRGGRGPFGAEPGFIGPVGARVEVVADEALEGLRGLVAGANEPDLHLRGVEPGRDFEADLGGRAEGRGRATPRPTAAKITIEPAIEVGNIFKLGTRYSEPLGARYLDEEGTGAARSGWAPTASARRASWPPRSSSSPTSRASRGRARWRRSTSSWSRSARRGRRPATVADRLYEELQRGRGSTCSTTTATASAGEKFADAELLGCPLRLTVGKRGVEAGEVEAQVRRGQEKRSLPLEGAAAAAARSCGASSPDQAQPLLGLDRSGGPPPETRRGQPLNPWTIPNAIGFVRLALIPVFLVVALESGRRPQRARVRPLRGDRRHATTSTAWRRAYRASTAASARCSTRSPTACSCSRA